jgi:hypothetical protein
VEAEHKMTTRIKLRRDTAANWTTSNPILAAGEPGLESDTGKIKYGDGVSRWNLLEHTGGDTLINEGAITVQTGDADRWFVRLRKEDDNLSFGSGVVVNSTNYDSEGNVLVVAQIDLNSDGVVVFKFTPAGELVWKKTIDGFGSPYYLDSFNAVVDSNDNLLFTVAADSNTASIVKINGSTGAIVFSEGLDLGTGYDLNAIAVDSNDNIIVGGRVYLEGFDLDTAFVVKLNTTATSITWQKELTVDGGSSFIHGIAIDFNNDIIVTGAADVDHQVDGNTVTDEEMLVAKIASAGTLSWQKTVALEADMRSGSAFGVDVDSIGNIYVTGTYLVDNAEADIAPADNKKSNAVVVFKMTTLGAMAWDRRIGPGPCSWVGVNTAVGDDGDLYILANTYEYNPLAQVDSNQGYYTSRMVLARYNKTTGAVIWQSYFDNPLAQEVPGFSGNGPWGGMGSDLLSIRDGKILIGGAVRFGQSDQDFMMPWSDSATHYNQGFLAQFDTDATYFSADGWELKTSRVPGKLTNTLVATTGTLDWQDTHTTINTAAGGSFEGINAPVSVRRTASKTNTWTFGKDGTFTAPADSNIKLQQKQLGFINMYGVMGNTDDSIWYNSVCHDTEGNAYVLGANNWTSDRAHIQKFNTDGELVWKRQLHSGEGAEFYVEWSNNTYTSVSVDFNGTGYKVGDKIVLPGSNFGGTDGVNSLTLEVTEINNSTDLVGGIQAVSIVSGVAVDGSSDTGNIADPYDDAECYPVALTFDPATGNIAVLVTIPTYNGDKLDNAWDQAVILQIDSGSGTVVKTITLSDEGDIYSYDLAVSSTGKLAVAGEKYNEYNDYGAVTPLAGSDTDILWVTKTDIDAEHYPGEPNGYYGDWYLTGSNFTGKARVTDVNYYTGLSGTTAQGSGAEFTIDNNGNGTYSVLITTVGSNYVVGHKIKILGTDLGGATPDNDITITIDAVDAGAITSVSNSGTAATVSGSGSSKTFTSDSGTFSSADGTILFSSPRSRSLSNAWSSFTMNSTITFVIGGTTYTSSLASPPVSGSNLDPMNPIPFTINIAGAPGAPDGTVTEFTISMDSGPVEISSTQSIDYDSMSPGGPFLKISKPVSNATYAAAIPNFPVGATVKAWDNMFALTEFTLTSAFIDDGSFWKATATQTSGSGNIFISHTVASPAGGGTPSYTGLSGANYNVGSGAVFYLNFAANTGSINGWGWQSSGSNYVVGDTITIAGTNFAGGTNPTNNVTITVTAADGNNGAINNIGAPSGTHPTTHLSLKTDRGVVFDAGGATFGITQNLGGEAFVWTADWNKAIGGGNTDRFEGVVWDAAGDNLYAVGTGRYEVNYDQALVVKYSSTGTLLASKYVNDTMGNNSAYDGAVALMADDSIVVVHKMYNDERDSGDEVLVTKLDSDLNMVWQQFIAFDSDDDGFYSPENKVSVAVDSATDEILLAWEVEDRGNTFNDDVMVFVKLDTDGQVLWKRMFGIHESDTGYNDYGNGAKSISIHGDKFTIVGDTDGPDDQTSNAMIATLPLDGTGTGLHDFWKYVEVKDTIIQVMKVTSPTSTTFTPNVHSSGISDTENVKYYYTDYPEEDFTVYTTVIRSNEGGAIEFSDGSKQSFSAANIPQIRSGGNRYVLRPEDSGRHILLETSGSAIVIPHHSRVKLPVGFAITIINVSNNTAYIQNENPNGPGYRGEMWFSGADTKTPYVGINDNGSGQMVTLVKIKEGTYSDDGEQHGDIWMIAGADIFDDN